jgi:hypothetical protein
MIRERLVATMSQERAGKFMLLVFIVLFPNFVEILWMMVVMVVEHCDTGLNR